MTILLSPRREPVNVGLPSGTSWRTFDVRCGSPLQGDLGAPTDLTAIRILVDELAGPAYAPPEDLDHFASIVRLAKVIVVFPDVSALDVDAYAAEVASYLDGVRVMAIVECSPAAGMAWLTFAIRLLGPDAVVVPVFAVPPGFNRPVTALPRTLH